MYLIKLRSVEGIVNQYPMPVELLGGEIAECWQRLVVMLFLEDLAHYLLVLMGYVKRKGNAP